MTNMKKLLATAPLLVAMTIMTTALGVTLTSGTASAQNRAFTEIENSRNMPKRGQSRNTVRSQYGEPISVRAAVGDPPISSWSYANFTVYFEYDHVITTVAAEDSLPTNLTGIQ